MAKRALITGVTGQDGSYLAELLLEKGYEVAGLIRRTSTPSTSRIAHLTDKIELIYGDLTDQSSIDRALGYWYPHEIYHLGAQSFVGESWTQPVATTEITGLGTLRMLEGMRQECPDARFYQASSSEQYGKVHETPQTEHTVFHPRSPYGVAKVYAHYATVNYRESYGLHASCGILFNHESPRRGIEFVTRKITRGVARIHLGLDRFIELGNLDAKRDWGDARDYVKGMWLMLQQDLPSDYILATGETRTIRDLLTVAFGTVGIRDWADYVRINPEFVRPAEVDLLLGDPRKAKEELGWVPEITFDQMISDMVANDIKLLENPKNDLDLQVLP